jgi:hypothetical protein
VLWPEPNDLSGSINIFPFKTGNLALPPAAQISKTREVFQMFWELRDQRLEIGPFKESFPDILFLQANDAGNKGDRQFSVRNGNRKCAS